MRYQHRDDLVVHKILSEKNEQKESAVEGRERGLAADREICDEKSRWFSRDFKGWKSSNG